MIKGGGTDQFFARAGLHVVGIRIGILQRVATLERQVYIILILQEFTSEFTRRQKFKINSYRGRVTENMH